MENQKTIKALQLFVTGLTEGAIVHRLQGQALKAKGFASSATNSFTTTPRRWAG